MADQFPAIAFQSALSIGAVLFGVFGFLYTIFAQLVTPSEPEDLNLPPIVYRLRMLCRIIAVLSLINTFLIAYSVRLLGLGVSPDGLLACGLALVVSATSLVCIYMAFWTML